MYLYSLAKLVLIFLMSFQEYWNTDVGCVETIRKVTFQHSIRTVQDSLPAKDGNRSPALGWDHSRRTSLVGVLVDRRRGKPRSDSELCRQTWELSHGPFQFQLILNGVGIWSLNLSWQFMWYRRGPQLVVLSEDSGNFQRCGFIGSMPYKGISTVQPFCAYLFPATMR